MSEPPPIGAASPDRSIDDRLGEALRRHRHGLVRPLWADMPAENRALLRQRAESFRRILEDVGLRVEVIG